MAWNNRGNDNWKWQLRDSKGRWIEMGRGVKWYSPTLGREVSGTVVGQKGRNAIVSLTSEPNDPKTNKPQQVSVKGSDIEVIQNKASLDPTADKLISATDEMLKQGQRQTAPAGPKATVPEDQKINAVSAKDDSVESKLDALEDVTVQADEGTLKGDALKKALDDAKFKVSSENGDYTVSAGKDENQEWNFLVSDKDGEGVDNIAMGVDDTKDVVSKIDKAIAQHEADKGIGQESTADEAAKPAGSEDYNENGLTDEEQKLADGYDRMADRADKGGKFDAADRYRAQKAELLRTGEERKKNPAAAAPKADLEEEAPEAPSEAPKEAEAPATPEEAPKAPEGAPKATEATPAASKVNVPLDDLEKQAKADGDTVLYHGGLPEGTTLDDIDLNRNGTQQNKRGRSFGGFYLTDESSKSWSDKYAMERNGVMHGFAIDKNARIDDRGSEQIDRLSAEDRAEAAKTSDVIKGKDMLGRTQYVILNKDVVKGVGETNLKDGKSSEKADQGGTPESTPTPEATPEPEAAPVDTAGTPAVMSLPVTPNLLNRVRRAVEDAGMTENESGLRFTSDRANPLEVVDLDKAEETLKGVKARVDDLASTARTAASKVPLNQASTDLSANIARIRAERDKSGAPEAVPAPEATPAAESAKPEAAAPKPVLSGEDALAAAGVERTEPEALPGEKFAPTRQQQDIIDAVLAGKNTAVQAKAGTGKTTTLEALAKRVAVQDPNKKIAYIAFNKTVQTEAQGRMPANVEPRTGHSVAFAWATPAMKKRSNDPNPIRRADEIAAYLGIKNTVRTNGAEPLSPKEQAMAATRTVDAYANSAEDRIEASHLPKNVQDLGPEAQKAVLDAANKIWEDVQKPEGGLKFTLDHMRKLWALSRPDFTKPGSGLKRPAQLIFMDESQDTPPVLARVMDEQTAQKVVVGDSDQNIYSSFTGSIDYMAQTQKDVELPLTKSWRFGPEVADIGNRFLQLVKSQGRVEGGGKSAIVEGMENADAILVRSNAGMVDEAIKEIEKGRTVGVPKDTKKDLNSMINSVAYLMGKGEAPTRMHDDLAAYRSWEEVLAEAEKGDATAKKISGLVARNGLGGLRAVVNEIVENGGDNLTGVVFNDQPHGRMAEGKTFNAKQYLKQAGFKWATIPGGGVDKKGLPKKAWTAIGTPEERDAMVARASELSGGTAVDVTIATAHKSKGLEWDKVKIGDDFRGPSVNEATGETEMPNPEELRLAYVATTRAKKELDPGSLGYVFEFTDENGGVPEAPDSNEVSNDPEEDRGTPTSTVTDEENSDTTVVEDQPTSEPSEVEQEPTGSENDPTDGSQPSDWEDAAPAPEEAPEAPTATPEESTEPAPVANETPVPEEEQEPEPEPEDVVSNPEEVPEPAPLPTKPANTPAPEPEAVEEPEVAPEPEAPVESPEPAPRANPYAPKPMADYSDEEFAGLPDGTRFPRNRQGGYYEKTGPNSWKQVSKGLEQVGGTYTDKDVRDAEGVPAPSGAAPEATPEAPEATPEPEAPVEAPAPAPAPVPAPEEAPAPAPGPAAPAPETAPAPEPGERPTSGTKAPEPKALHPVKAKAGNYPDGTVIRSTRTGEALQKTDGKWHVAGRPDTPGDPMNIDSPYVYDMPKQPDETFGRFEGIDSVGPGDVVVTRKGTQAAVVGKRNGRLVVAAHNQTEEQRRLRPALAEIDPAAVKGVNKFDAVPETAAPKSGGTATERKRTPFSSNRGNTNLSIKDVAGNEIKTGDEVRTDLGTGTIVRVRPSDGPSGSAFVQFPDGTIKSFRSNKLRSTAAAAPEASGGDDPSQMEIGAMGEAGDGRAFMVGKGNKPIFKGSRIALADGREGTVSGFAKGVQSVNLKMDDGTTPRKKASVVDAIDYNAPETTTSESDTTPAPAPEPEAPATPEAEGDPEPMPVEETPVVEAKQGETPEEREERIAEATSNSKDPGFLSSWWDIVMKDDLQESDIYEIAPDAQWKMESMFKGELTRDNGGILAAKGWGIAAWSASKDSKRTPEQQAKMKDLQARITLFTQIMQERVEDEAKETARQNNAPVREPDYATPDENMSLKSDRALKPQAALKGAELDAYSGIQAGAWGGDLFGDNSRLNVLSEAGKELGTSHVLTNSKGSQFRQGMKVYSPVGRYLGVAKSVQTGRSGALGFSVRKGDADPRRAMSGGDLQTYDIERLISQPTPPVWKNQADLTFGEDESYASVTEKMTRAYPGVHFNFRDDIPLPRTREYAETVSKMLNKYPQLSATLTSVESSPIDPKIKAFAYASTSNHSGLRDTKVVFNSAIGKRIKGAMRAGSDAKYFNNVPEGKEMEYVMTHEFGHTIDYMTGNISDNEVFELMKELLPPEVLADKKNLGKYLFDNGMISEYSKDEKSNKIYTVELVAESFADVELNGAAAKPISKLVHAELMKRLDEISGGTGVIPQGPTQAPTV